MVAGGTPALEARGLSKRYGRTWALRDVDVEIPRGGITALVGPNAAGKSTLIRTWVGFEQPTSGTAWVAGANVRRDGRAARQSVGYVPQSPTLYDTLTVDQHVQLATKLRPGFDADLARQRLQQLGIPLARGGRRLSGGQQAQVALSLALGTRATVLLLDEPLASLDPLARRDFLQLLREAVSATGATALLSSHVVTDIEQVCDRIVVLGVGRVLLDARIEDAVAAHAVGTGTGSDGMVGSFTGANGEVVSLRRRTTTNSATLRRAATLEDVVLGYLSGARVDETPGNTR